jgi:hypothetical protein
VSSSPLWANRKIVHFCFPLCSQLRHWFWPMTHLTSGLKHSDTGSHFLAFCPPATAQMKAGC